MMRCRSSRCFISPQQSLALSRLCRRNHSRVLVACAAAKPPSMKPSATELESLEEMSIVVPDTLILEETSEVEKPKAATVSPGVLGGILSSPSGLRQYKNAVENAKSFAKDPQSQMNKALANVGALFAEEVEGRVSTELDPRLSNDTDAMVEQGRAIVGLYKDLGVPQSKTLIQLPGTWEGIQAAKQLETEGVNTVVFLVYSIVQGVAAAQAGVSVIQINMGRLQDWYNSHPGVIRDPQGPREDAGCSSAIVPGQRLVSALYDHCKKYHPKTQVMVSGIRTKEDALAVAGCDYVILGPKVLKALNEAPTAQGYNDGLSAKSTESGVTRVLSPKTPSSDKVEAWERVYQRDFDELIGMAGKELVDQGVKILESDLERLLPTFADMTVGTE